MSAEVVRLDDKRASTPAGRDEQVLIEADRIRDGLTSPAVKQRNNRR